MWTVWLGLKNQTHPAKRYVLPTGKFREVKDMVNMFWTQDCYRKPMCLLLCREVLGKVLGIQRLFGDAWGTNLTPYKTPN